MRGVDIKRHEYFDQDPGDEFIIADMRDPTAVRIAIDDSIDEVYNLAADMGGAGYVDLLDCWLSYTQGDGGLKQCGVWVNSPCVTAILIAMCLFML